MYSMLLNSTLKNGNFNVRYIYVYVVTPNFKNHHKQINKQILSSVGFKKTNRRVAFQDMSIAYYIFSIHGPFHHNCWNSNIEIISILRDVSF